MEWRARRWRGELWSCVGPGRIIELGVGTGKNLRYYPPGRDISPWTSDKMLAHARKRAEPLGSRVRLERGDVQALRYPDASFDVVVGTFLSCSVPDPLLGLAEARRVLVPGGRLLLLEHVLSHRPLLRRVMQWIDPVTSRIWGAHIDRDTVDNVRRAGFGDVAETDLWIDVIKRIETEAP